MAPRYLVRRAPAGGSLLLRRRPVLVFLRRRPGLVFLRRRPGLVFLRRRPGLAFLRHGAAQQAFPSG